MIHNRILTLAIILLCWVNIQTGKSQTTEKWLPSSIVIYSDSTQESISILLNYDTKNRLTRFSAKFSLKEGHTQSINYGLDNRPIEILQHKAWNDSIKIDKKHTIKYFDNNIIEITDDPSNIYTLYIDDEGKFLQKIVQNTTDSIKTKYMTSTLEYRNGILYKRTEKNINVNHNSEPIDIESIGPPVSEAKPKAYTYHIDVDKKSAFEDFQPRWLSAFLKIEDIADIFVGMFQSIDGSMGETNISYKYNSEGYPTGWEVTDYETDDVLHCKIDYIKAK